MFVGERLKKLREREYSQEDLADILKVSNVTISKWENGSQEPRANRVAELARVLGTTPDYLMGYTDNPAPATQSANLGLTKKEGDISSLDMGEKEGMLFLKTGAFEMRLPDTEKNSELFRSIITQMLTVSGRPVGVDSGVNILDGGHSNNYHNNVVTTK